MDLVWFTAPRGVELPMTGGKVGQQFHLVLSWGAPSRTLVVVRLVAQVEEVGGNTVQVFSVVMLVVLMVALVEDLLGNPVNLF